MVTKRLIALFIVFCLLLAGCVNVKADSNENSVPTENSVSEVIETPDPTADEQAESAQIITPLPDATMENLTDAILHVSLEEGKVYADDQSIIQMDLAVYTYDKYDMIDIANLKIGDTIVRYYGEVEVTSIERNEHGTVYINGGLEAEGFELVTDDDGIFYERSFNDSKDWYCVGAVTLQVSIDFVGTDSADLDLGEVMIYPDDFMNGEVTNYDFSPYNTTIRVENGQIVELNRVYIP